MIHNGHSNGITTRYEVTPIAVEECERSVVGAVLLHASTLERVIRDVAPGDFYHPALRAIFEAAVELHEGGRPIDEITILAQMEVLSTAERLRAFGGASYLTELAVSVVTVENVEYHARQIRLTANRRAARAVFVELQRNVERDRDAGDLDGLLHLRRQFEERLGELEARVPGAQRIELVDLTEAITPATIASCAEPATTGLKVLDEKLGGGFFAGDLNIIQAPPGQGKTSFAVMSACSDDDPERITLYVSTEMRPDELAARRVCQVLAARSVSCSWRQVLRGDVPLERRQEALDGVRVKVLRVHPGEPATPEIFRWAQKLADKSGRAPRVIVDFLQGLNLAAEDRRLAVSTTAYALRRLAEEMKAVIFAISSMGRGGYSKEARKSTSSLDMLSRGKESGDIEYAAAVVLDLLVEDDEDEQHWRSARIHVAKQRFGGVGEVGMRFHGPSGRFEAAELEELVELRDQVFAAIASGTWGSAVDLAKHLGVQKDKVRRSVKQLTSQGMIKKVGGFFMVGAQDDSQAVDNDR